MVEAPRISYRTPQVKRNTLRPLQCRHPRALLRMGHCLFVSIVNVAVPWTSLLDIDLENQPCVEERWRKLFSMSWNGAKHCRSVPTCFRPPGDEIPDGARRDFRGTLLRHCCFRCVSLNSHTSLEGGMVQTWLNTSPCNIRGWHMSIGVRKQGMYLEES